MNMIQKMYNCEIPNYYGGDRSYKVSAWMAEGSNTVNMRTFDPNTGWSKDYPELGIFAVWSEKLSDYAKAGVKTMDDLIEYLYLVIKA